MKIAIHGAGRMGREVESVARERGHEIVGLFDSERRLDSTLDADMIVDFSHADAISSLLDVATGTGTSVVTGTTGWEPEAIRDRIESSGIGFAHAPNFSPGAAILFAAAAAAARTAAAFGDFSSAIHERHHSGKKDSPSGTALRLASQVTEASDGSLDPEIAASRVGHEAGLHTLIIDGESDLVEITHRARGRKGFASGAVVAAELLDGRHGFFTLEELLEKR